MLEKENRLTKDKDFDKVFKFGKSAYSDILGIKIMHNDQQKSRFGIMVNTKVSKKAVDRNRAKRLIREIVKNKISALLFSCDVVVIALPSILDKDINDVERAIKLCFKKTGVVK